MNNKKTKVIAGIGLALLVIAAILAVVFLSPGANAGEKNIVFQVTHTDGTVKDFKISTDSENLRAALEQEGLVAGDESAYGLFVTAVDGEAADDSQRQWWCFTRDGVMLETSVDSTMIADGEHYEAFIDVYFKLSLRELSLLSLMGALMFALQVALASLPNIHLTALLIILTAVFFGWKCLFSVAVFIMLEALVWGFGLWWLCYWYLWPLLAIPAVLMRRNRSAFLWAVLAALHGLFFGALCSIPYLFIGGWEMAFSYWISGLSFDLIHCAGNFVLTLTLFDPLYRAMDKLTKN